MNRIRAGILAAAALWTGAAQATLYSTSGGYQYTTGSQAYWDHEVWAYGGLRLTGGWYPFTRLTGFTDSNYRWGAAPTAGIEKGLPGLGRPRAAYTAYVGEVRQASLQGVSHSVELGWFRAFTPTWSGDAAYRVIRGDLFGGINEVFNAQTASSSAALRQSTLHQGTLTVAHDVPAGGRTLRLQGGLSAASGTGGLESYTESAGVGVPLRDPLALQTAVTFLQGRPGPDRVFFGAGLLYTFSGRLERE